MTLLLLTLAILPAQPPHESAPPTVIGRVFHDKNANGQFDPNEPGLADIPISDGIQFILTNKDGSFEMKIADDPLVPHKPAQVVAMSWPSNTWPTTSWHRRLSDIKASEPVLFGLRDDEQKLPFSFVHISDMHDQGGGFERLAPEIRKLQPMPKFCINTGDLLYANYGPLEKCEAGFQNYAANRKKMPIPVFESIGNHDYTSTDEKNANTKHPRYACGNWTRHVAPVRYSFNYAGVHFVSLDWAYLDGDFYASGTGNVTLAWLEKDLALLKRPARVVAFAHYPSGTERFWPVISQNKIDLFLGGHSHKYKDWTYLGVRSRTTMNLANIASTLCIADDKTIHLVDRCPDCKNNHHSKRCALADIHLGAIASRRAQRHEFDKFQLMSTERPLFQANDQPHEIIAEIEPHSAKKFGIKLTARDPKAPPFELTASSTHLLADGLAIPFERTADEKVRLHFIIDNGAVEMIANKRLRYVKRWQPGPFSVTPIAHEGAATFQKTEIWSLKK